MPSAARDRLAQAGIELPAFTVPASNYLALRRHGDLIFCAGVTSDGFAGQVTADGDLEQARSAAQLCACRQLASLDACLGSLDVIDAVLRVTGYVACSDGFSRTPAVLDAASDVFVTAFGDAGRHARSAVGVRALPGDATVELEAIVAVRPSRRRSLVSVPAELIRLGAGRLSRPHV